ISQHADRRLQQIQAGCSLVLRIRRRKMAADVALPGGAEQRVDHGVGQHVSVGVAVEPDGMFDMHSAKDERATRAKRMRVIAGADPHVVAASCSLMSASTTS